MSHKHVPLRQDIPDDAIPDEVIEMHEKHHPYDYDDRKEKIGEYTTSRPASPIQHQQYTFESEAAPPASHLIDIRDDSMSEFDGKSQPKGLVLNKPKKKTSTFTAAHGGLHSTSSSSSKASSSVTSPTSYTFDKETQKPSQQPHSDPAPTRNDENWDDWSDEDKW